MKICTTEKIKEKTPAGQALTGLLWLGLWQLLATLVAKPLLLPSPLETAAALARLASEQEFYLNLWWTLARCIFSMGLSFITGMAAAGLAYRFAAFRRLMTVPVGFFKAVPVMAIVIYVVLLVTADLVAVIVCFLMCFPVVYTNVLAGLDSSDRELLELACIYELRAFQKLRYIYLPGIQSEIKASVRLIAGLSWKAVVAAEVLSVPAHSLGYEMINAKYYLETPKLFAYILVIVVLSLALEKLIDKALDSVNAEGYEGSRVLKSLKPRCREAGGADKEKIRGIYLEGVAKSYGDKRVADNLTMELAGGKITAVAGPSGQGKTTLARLIAGLEEADEGRIRIMAERADGSLYEYSGRIAYLFQEDRLIPWLNIFDNMALSLIGGGYESREQVEARIEAMAEALELSEALWKLPEQLSGGMRHRAALGRTFAAQADLVILDEPFRGLDRDLKDRIVEGLWEKEMRGKTALMITHDLNDAKKLSDRIINYRSFAV